VKVSTQVLARFVDAPTDPKELRELMDDVGLEVKRMEPMAGGTRFTLELLANRGDHHCYEGIARELDGRLGRGLRSVPVAPLEVGASPHPLVNTTPLCMRYSLTLMERTSDARLSAEALAVLDGAGIHSLTAPVDATNVANLELGQPTHAFDADTIVGPVTIRLSAPGERCRPLFQEGEVELPEGTLVIADDAKILAVAGVIGCEESKTTETTTRLLLESACFDPVAVRKASRALSIHTDSSARFERGADPKRVLAGAGRVVALLEEAGWSRVGTTGMVGEYAASGLVIPLSVAATGAFLDLPLDAAEISERLGRYGFDVRADAGDADKLLVSVPSWRIWDVAFAADLYEELAKSIGYNATPIALPPVRMGATPSLE
jgi:phenylalanyl-tRNA synthetase beta chain